MSRVSSLASSEFLLWLVVFVPLFGAAVAAVSAVSPGPMWTFVAGIVFGEVASRLVDPFVALWRAKHRTTDGGDAGGE